MPLRALLDILFPPLCHLCKAFIPHASDLHLCPSCLDKVTFVSAPLCPVCGVPFASPDISGHRCGACILRPPPFQACRAATFYTGPVQELIHRFKYGGKVHLALPLGLITSRTLAPFHAEAAPEVIVPVPLHRKRLRQRGYNQSQLLSEMLGKKWRMPLMVGNLRRVRWTEPQTSLTAEERGRNVRGAFAVKEPQRLRGKRVLLVDDVLTTGSTVGACSHALRDAGVAAIYVVTVARGVRSFEL